jgi:2-phosphoglycerate kinase
MAKTFVTDPVDGTRVPFLRGILTRSLNDAGIEFDEAYKLASNIRQALSEVDEIPADALRAQVTELLQERFDHRIVDAYQSSGQVPSPVVVTDEEGQKSAFSESQHIRCLESSGLSSEEAEKASRWIFQYLNEQEITRITSSRLGHLTYTCLNDKFGPTVAKRYLVWIDYTHSGRPLILLIGGTTGCGKSTIATEVAHRLGVVRTQSTDMLREVMRMMIPERLLPILHVSAFDAWKSLPAQPSQQEDMESLIADGYRSQMELLSVPCEAVIQRALRERVSLILEGVHVHPSLLARIDRRGDAIIVPVLLATLKQKRLRERLRGRGEETPERGGKRYLSNFDRIWTLQSFLLSEADLNEVPIIANDDKEKTTVQVMRTIINAMMDKFSSTPSEVFGDEQ